MTTQGRIVFGTIVLIICIALGAWWYMTTSSPGNSQIVGGDKDTHGCIGSAGYSWCEARNICIRPWETYCTAASAKTVIFSCTGSSTIKASFYPTDNKYVDLELSDSRKMSVARAISASGARYANADESFVFWNKGDTAFITEGVGTTSTTTFGDCVLLTQ